MPTFPSKKFRPTGASTGISALGPWYRRQLTRRPFLSFGLPFILTIVAGSFALTPAAAIRYEMHDRKVQQVAQEEALGLGKNRHRFDVQEDYYRLAAKVRYQFRERRSRGKEAFLGIHVADASAKTRRWTGLGSG